MTTTQVVETSVTVNNNSPIQDYVHPDNQTQPTFEMTPEFKPFTVLIKLSKRIADLWLLLTEKEINSSSSGVFWGNLYSGYRSDRFSVLIS